MSYTPYSVYKAERLLRRRRRWVLFSVVGLLVIVGVVVGGSLLWGYVQWQKTQINDPGLTETLDDTPVNNLYPAPEGTTNVLILGIDDRGWEAIRSDSMILVHIDPSNNYLSTLSLPRDLYVEVPGNGMQKLNFAYAKDGAKLAVQTVENLTGVDITQYMEVDLEAFEGLTDALGGVYLDVDKHYLQTDPDKELADIPMGYQLLDGAQSLDYVRFRNDDNMDFGRQARQQRFLAALREQSRHMNMTELPGLVTTMCDNIKTTIGYDDVLSLAYWALTGDMHVRQATIVGPLERKGDLGLVVVADETSLRQKIQDFATAPSDPVTVSTTQDTTATPQVVSVDSSQFVTNPLSISNAAMWVQIAQEMPFKVMAPGYVPAGYVYFDKNPQSGPGYDIDTGGGTQKGLKLIYQLQVDGTPKPQYIGIMETPWLDAPAASSGRQVEYNGIMYTIVGTYDQTERIWWVKDDVLYWVSNTILHYLDDDDLLKVAASMMTIETGGAQ